MSISVSVVGASGRMGSLAVALIDSSADLQLHSKLNSQTPLDHMLGADVVLDFTRPDVSPSVVSTAIANGARVVVGTSGWSATAVGELSRRVAQLNNGSSVLIVPNFSLGSTLAQHFATRAARFFDSIEIVEHHHAGKVDSPSGTAVRTAELIHQARADMTQPLIPGVEQPARGQVVAGVPVHSLRLTGSLATQETHFAAADEHLVIRHVVHSPRAYQQGIYLAVTKSVQVTGVLVGLENLIEL